MDFSKINNAAKFNKLPTRRVKDLEKNNKFLITKLRDVTTQYGQKVVAVVDNEFQFFLPKRISDMLYADIEYFNRLCDMATKFMLHVVYTNENILEFCN